MADSQTRRQRPTAGAGQPAPLAGYTLIELLLVIVILAILAAIALPVYLGQRDRAKEATVKEGVHAIRVGVQAFAVEHDDTYPAAAEVDEAGAVGALIEQWPDDPWSPGTAMANTGTLGNYTYVLGAGGGSFTLQGHGKSGVVINFP